MYTIMKIVIVLNKGQMGKEYMNFNMYQDHGKEN